jgi:hypothetical protein
MSKFFSDVFGKVLASAIWDNIKGVGMTAALLGLIAWLRDASWLILVPLLIGVGVAVNWLSQKLSKTGNSDGSSAVQNNDTGIELKTRKSPPSFWDEVEKAGQVWAFWYNGGDALNRKIFQQFKRPNKLVLLDNKDDALLDYHARLHHTQKDTQRIAIRDTADAAKKAGIEVKYWPNPMPFSMTFFEPESQNGRVQIEFQIPDAPIDQSPSVVIHREVYPDVYGNLLAFFRRAHGETIE